MNMTQTKRMKSPRLMTKIINLLDHFPKAGETVQDEYAEYRVLEATNNRIDKVKVHLLPQKDTTADLDEEEGV